MIIMQNIDVQLSQNFKLSEFLYTERDFVFGVISPDVFFNIFALCRLVLQPLRSKLERPVLVSSGYRPEVLNKLVGGVTNSRHLYGAAADLIFDYDSEGTQMYDILKKNPNVGELIINYERNYIHVSLKNFNYEK